MAPYLGLLPRRPCVELFKTGQTEKKYTDQMKTDNKVFGKLSADYKLFMLLIWVKTQVTSCVMYGNFCYF